ncbi:tyrosine-type recombinase/integrase [Amycolatopsis sp. FDAARGOS 1241]|uniref:tyrosine-type recombinase/integrase n=1 Tax=Amycolatopsis sp. FDAARGOS 1241 TaxID=2778070 RepID=UPI0019517B56|nr:tyrosine-type recombinase/integrase [Amycolatopsis sp. FDAARGOS 1241]QRP49081.1 tyrosine-type recombinase/integrase [Amycolatopsis sp. FDAARGOS 1241]
MLAPRWDALEDAASPTERLATLDAIAETYVRTQRPANTLRAYASDWRVWEDYTAEAGIPLLAGTPGALVGFVWWLETRKHAAPATIDRRLTGVTVTLRAQYKVAVERVATQAARHALAGYQRRLAEAGLVLGRGQARPITVAELRQVSRACPDTVAGLRDRALVLLEFGIAGRVSDVSHLLARDIAEDPRGLVVTVRYGKSVGTSPIVHGEHPETCAVRAWHRWVAAALLQPEGAALRPVDRWGRVGAAGLSPQAIDEILVRAGERAGLGYRLTGHSLRSGLATELRRAGASDDEIADQGRWKRGSRALQLYFRVVDRWTNNALSKLDL